MHLCIYTITMCNIYVMILDPVVKIGLGVGVGSFIFMAIFLGIGFHEMILRKRTEVIVMLTLFCLLNDDTLTKNIVCMNNICLN